MKSRFKIRRPKYLLKGNLDYQIARVQYSSNNVNETTKLLGFIRGAQQRQSGCKAVTIKDRGTAMPSRVQGSDIQCAKQ